MVPSSLRRRSAALAAVLAGCVSYVAEDVTLPGAAVALPHHDGALTFDAAVALAMAHNGEIRAREAECRAAGLEVAPTELELQLEQKNLALLVDPLALLGMAQRGARARVAEARAVEAAAALAQTRWRTVAAIAEVFAHCRALDALPPPPVVDVDGEAFAAAGLASPLAVAQIEGATAAAAAARQTLDAERAAQLAELRRLLGLSPASVLELVLPPADWPPSSAGGDEALLRRPDLALALADYQVADAAFRQAVAEQYPSLMVGPDVPLRGGSIEPMAVLRLPVGATGPARAAQERRAAARHRLDDALAAAAGEAAAAAFERDAAAARAAAALAGARASAQNLAAALVALQVDFEAFEGLPEKAIMAVRDANEARDAAIAADRARVRAAVAAGWPAAEAVP